MFCYLRQIEQELTSAWHIICEYGEEGFGFNMFKLLIHLVNIPHLARMFCVLFICIAIKLFVWSSI